ncbi:unnamed protein product [Parnassius mnemosyne]|uniref:Reverse transcriptase zinc-binding domain-containing protein n=1 Tax=Parnassius mnemosyne TaxID=213953 RepID=A0AAV1L783_9NEOP
MASKTKFDSNASSECICDSEKEETVEHLLLECPKNIEKRLKLEIITNIKLKVENICVLLECKRHRNKFIEYCIDIAKEAINRNKTR